ncbi:MAG: hypothetical protein ABIS17_01815 [Casimicrobiaceae bacterium]
MTLTGAPMTRQRGIALVLALWITILLTVIASSFAFSMRSEALAARNAVSGAQARAVADGAVDRMAYELLRPRNSPEVWSADGQVRQWRDGDIAVSAVAVDESARIDLNAAPQPLLLGLLQNVGGLVPEEAQAVLDAILDWKDQDDLRRPNGAEDPEYRAAGRKYRPANGPFESVGELRRVIGVTPALYDRIAETLTVYSQQGGINPVTASREVLLALPSATPDAVDAFLVQRQEALGASLPVPAFPPAQAFRAGPAPLWRIHAEAVAPDGVTFVRDAVVRPASDPRRGLIALLWQEGTCSRCSLPQPASAQEPSSPPNANAIADR